MKEVIIKLLNKWACSHTWEYLCHMYASADYYTCSKCGKIKKINI